MKGVRVPDDRQLAACQYAYIHGDEAAMIEFDCSVESLRAWRKKFGFKKRSRAPKNPSNRVKP